MKTFLKIIFVIFIGIFITFFLLVIFPLLIITGFLLSLFGVKRKTHTINFGNFGSKSPTGYTVLDNQSEKEEDVIDIKAKEINKK